MTVLLMPRLRPDAVDAMLDDWGDDLKIDRSLRHIEPPERAWFASSGGATIGAQDLEELERDIDEIAMACGYPGRTRQDMARFDAEIAALLATSPILASGEALRDEVWAWFATARFPDVTLWRYGKARARWHGGVRNTFQRLWMRGVALDRGQGADDRWGLLRLLSEDALVQISERPAIGSDPVLAREIAEAWVRFSARFGAGAMEDLMREAIKGVRARNELFTFTLLDDELPARIDAEFERAAARLRLSPALVTSASARAASADRRGRSFLSRLFG